MLFLKLCNLALRNAQDSFSVCLKDFQLGFVGDTNEEESDIGKQLI
jgi:hypothetical protein